MERVPLAFGALTLALAAPFVGIAGSQFDRKLSKEQQIVHALNRLTFGPRPGDTEQVQRMGIEKWIDLQLHPERIPENPLLEAKLMPLQTIRLASWQILETYQPRLAGPAVALKMLAPMLPPNVLLTPRQRQVFLTGSTEEKRALLESFDVDKRRQVVVSLPPDALGDLPEVRRESMAARQPLQFVNSELMENKLYRAVYSNRQLEEVLVDFWLNHFNVFNGKGPGRMLLTSYERDAIRPFVLARFKDMLLATARHPAMLYYLDNWQSQAPREDPPARRGGPVRRPGLNENYGRELLELHTLGVDGGYTQQDVIAVARAFTGWTIREPNRVGEFQFNPAMHD